MKKALALIASCVITMGTFVGCGTSQEDLNYSAKNICNAFNSALSDADEKGYDIGQAGYIASDGSHTFLENNAEAYDFIISDAQGFCEDMSKFSYVVYIESGTATKAYVADSMDSDKIGTYPADLDASGTLEDIKNNIPEIVEEPTTEEPADEDSNSDISDTVEESVSNEPTAEETTKKTSSTNKTFDFTAEEFVEEYNANVPIVFGSDAMTLSPTESTAEDTKDTKYFSYRSDGLVITLTCNTDEYVENIMVGSNVSITSQNDTNTVLAIFEMVLSPYIVINKGSKLTDILSFISTTEPSENSSTDSVMYDGDDGKAKYTIGSSDLIGTMVVIFPK
ncbi:MAG: hypothetical protein J6B75_09655 [Ruminococcus sp.]|nr:hypothetical protein [Ruminococcus sp.]